MAPARRTLLQFAMVATALACGGLVVVFLVALLPIWPCVLLEHFRVQLIGGGLVILACAGALRMRGYFDVAAVITVLHILALAPDGCRSPRQPPVEGQVVRVLVLNVHT